VRGFACDVWYNQSGNTKCGRLFEGVTMKIDDSQTGVVVANMVTFKGKRQLLNMRMSADLSVMKLVWIRLKKLCMLGSL